jgi:hypothetical protein
MIQSSKKSTPRVFLRVLLPVSFLVAFALLTLAPKFVAMPVPQYIYRTELVQATPGKLLELIDLYKQKAALEKDSGDEPSLMIRHSQGDRWDLLRLVPMQSYAEYYSADRIAARIRARSKVTWMPTLRDDIAWEEDINVFGPPLDVLRKAFADGGLFHVEMFESLPGKQADLYYEREMENTYSAALGQPENFIFLRDQGAAWDNFSIGVFRDLKHFAASSDATPDAQAAAAKKAGFTSPSDIGPYLRTLIRLHRDTLAVAIK